MSTFIHPLIPVAAICRHTFAVNYDNPLLLALPWWAYRSMTFPAPQRILGRSRILRVGKLPVIPSDATGAIAKSCDLAVKDGKAGFKDSRGVEINHGFAERTTFIVTPDGKVAATVGGVSRTSTKRRKPLSNWVKEPTVNPKRLNARGDRSSF